MVNEYGCCEIRSLLRRLQARKARVRILKIEPEGEAVGVSKKGEKYLCEICGNEVTVTKVGGGTLVCCGEEMTLIEE